jgi:hypothetical protein
MYICRAHLARPFRLQPLIYEAGAARAQPGCSRARRAEMKDLLCSDIQALLNQAIVDGTNRPKSYYKGFVMLPLEINDCIEFTNQKIQTIQTQLQSMPDGQHERKLMESMLSNFEKLMPVLVQMEDNKRCAEEYDFYGSCFYQAASISAQNVMMQTE